MESYRTVIHSPRFETESANLLGESKDAYLEALDWAIASRPERGQITDSSTIRAIPSSNGKFVFYYSYNQDEATLLSVKKSQK